MASYDPDFPGVRPDEKGSPGFDAEPRGRGCLFYGCVTVIVAGVVLALALALGALVLYRTAVRYRDLYTSTAPVALPKPALSGGERDRAVARVRAFVEGLEAGREVGPLRLTGDDLNALVEEAPELKGRVFLAIEGDKVKAKVSFPLSEIHDVSLTRGRYLNGEAEVELAVEDGRLDLTVVSMSADGKVVPKAVRDILDEADVFLDDDDDDTNDSESERRIKSVFRRIDSLEVKDGVMIVTPRPPGEAPGPKAGRGAEAGPGPAPNDP